MQLSSGATYEYSRIAGGVVFAAGACPPSTLLGVSFLGYAEQLVEIEAVATVAP